MQLQEASLSLRGCRDSESDKDPSTTTPRDVISVVSSLSSDEDSAGSVGEHEVISRTRKDSNVSVISGIVMDDGGGTGWNFWGERRIFVGEFECIEGEGEVR